MSRSTLNTVLLAIFAAAASVLAVRELSYGDSLKFLSELRPVKNWQAIADSSTVLLEGDGSNIIVVFSDFQCPYCARVSPVLRGLVEKHPGRVTVSYRHLPLTRHEHAMAAAMASECAADQGAFREFHDLLFTQQDSLGVIPWETFARSAGVVDPGAFSECLRTERRRDRVETDFALALELDLRVAPSFLVNGRRVKGLESMGELERLFR